MDKSVERRHKEAVLRSVGRGLKQMGFERTKPTFFTRERGLVIEFVHLHKFSLSPKFRIHLGIRVLNDPFDSTALNGPATSDAETFEFGEDEASVNRCADQIVLWCERSGLGWFNHWSDPCALVSSGESPLDPDARDALASALSGEQNDENVLRSRQLLGSA